MIRELRLCDVPACIEIVRQNWDGDIANRFALEIAQAFQPNIPWPPIYYVFEHNNQVVGFAGMISSWVMHGVFDFIWINVRSDYHRQDIGTALTRHRIEQVRQLGGSAINIMTQNYGFFKRFGFKVLHVYEGPENETSWWCLMTMQLKPMSIFD